MKIQNLILSIVLFLFIADCFSDEYTLLSTSNPLVSINQLTSNKIVAFGTDYCYTSSNIGQTWSLPKYLSYSSPSKTFFVDSVHGWALENTAPFNKIYRTVIGEIGWNLFTTPSPDTIYSFYFVTKDLGWAFGRNGLLMKTTNASTAFNWTISRIPFKVTTTLSGIYMVNSNRGFIYSIEKPGYLLRTTNGGNSWDSLVTSTGHASMQIQFLDSLNGWSLGYDNSIIRTTNGGLTWSIINSSLLGGHRYMIFKSLTTGWYYDIQGRIFKSTNSGGDWFLQRGGGGSNSVRDIYFTDINTGWIAGNLGNILKTTDGGASWNYQCSPPTAITKLYSPALNTCYLISDFASLSRTTNSGNTWDKLVTGSNRYFSDVKTINTNNIYLCGSSGLFYRSVDAGLHWDTLTISNKNLNCLSFINLNTGWSCGESGAIYKTTNSGFNWITLASGTTDNIKSILFSDSLNGAANTNNGIYNTVNGGANWQFNGWGTNYNFLINSSLLSPDISFMSANSGWSGGGFPFDLRIIQKSTNRGVSWTTILQESQMGVGQYVNGVNFINQVTGYCLDYAGVRKTENGGTSWNYQSLPVQTSLISLFNESTGFFASSSSLLTNYYTSGIENSNLGFIPYKFLLHQNYPNPFNPSTKINYEIKSSGFVNLKVFDLLGKEVATLVNEKQNAGSYAIDFNSSEFNLPSGIYFYTLNAGEFKETRKMVLVK